MILKKGKGMPSSPIYSTPFLFSTIARKCKKKLVWSLMKEGRRRCHGVGVREEDDLANTLHVESLTVELATQGAWQMKMSRAFTFGLHRSSYVDHNAISMVESSIHGPFRHWGVQTPSHESKASAVEYPIFFIPEG